ncbi:MAG: ABC transporter substrate-binding protein [Microcystis aeruginosa DA14]|uniref:ABC transporter substrate-binding protein n=1 Tax=Microcystis aeruginosa DA14 TaxID=1987506 RepID=A0A3E0MDG8_MICAE|nr:MAG: ABC transporter substrate-binding protein [Microcystis aeruginosa DA14]
MPLRIPELARRLVVALPIIAGFAAPLSAQPADTRPVITIAVQQIVTSGALEPLREQSNVGARIFDSIFENLIEVDKTGDLSLKPGLAESYRRIDPQTIEFTLRRGVKFHDGREMTAEDVVFTFGRERMWGTGEANPQTSGQPTATLFAQGAQGATSVPREAVAIAGRLLPAFGSMEAVGPYTVRYTNRVADLTLEGRLTRNGTEIISRAGFQAAENWGAWARRPVGTGPYRVKEFRPDNILVLEAHDDYWGGRPPIRELRFVVVPEIATRVNGLLSGQFDFITDVPPDQFRAIERSARHDVIGGAILNHRLLVFDKNHPRLQDPRIRRALTHAIDRNLIVEALFQGKTSVPAGLQWEYYGPMFHSDWTVPAFDPALARRLLQEAGYRGEVIPYRVASGYYTNQVPTAQALQQMWQAVGLNVQLQMVENWQQIFDRSNPQNPRAIRDWSNSAPFNDPVSSIVNQHCERGQQQQAGEWTNADFNRLCTVLETSTNADERRSTFRRMLEIIEREDPGYTVLHRSVLYFGKRKDIEWKPSPTQAMDFRASNFRIVPATR